MIEEIKKEHTVLKRFIIKRGLYEALLNDDEFIEHLNTEYPIEPDYKSAWNELKESQSTNCAYVNLGEELEVRFAELEQKYKLGGE